MSHYNQTKNQPWFPPKNDLPAGEVAVFQIIDSGKYVYKVTLAASYGFQTFWLYPRLDLDYELDNEVFTYFMVFPYNPAAQFLKLTKYPSIEEACRTREWYQVRYSNTNHGFVGSIGKLPTGVVTALAFLEGTEVIKNGTQDASLISGQYLFDETI